jgi:perosamine synthetase
MILLSGPNINGNEWKYVKECLDTAWVSSVGSYVDAFEKKLAEFTGAKYAVATSNGTTALHISLIVSGIRPGDLVVVPNITFVASANSIKHAGAEPLLIDVDPETWQMDLNLLEKYLKENTYHENGQCIVKKSSKVIKAIMPVHVLGNMVDMERLQSISEKYNITIIEDATEALGSYYNDQHSGTFGKLGCFSFNGNKLITTGGGGMIVTDDESLAKRAKHLTTQAKVPGGEYFHDEVGYNYRLVNVLSAIGVAQMEQLPGFLKRKKEVKDFYMEKLGKIDDIGFQKVDDTINPNWWLFTLTTSRKDEMLKILNENGYQSRPLWVPMNELPIFEKNLYITEDNHSKKIYDKCISIPCSTNITDDELQQVVDKINELY